LYLKYKAKGLVVLGFPCNQFANEEPDPEATIKEFVKTKYGITFPMFSKIDVNGPDAHPIFVFLKQDAVGADDIAWNFNKFLVGRDGKPVKRYATKVEPMDIEADILEQLG